LSEPGEIPVINVCH